MWYKREDKGLIGKCEEAREGIKRGNCQNWRIANVKGQTKCVREIPKVKYRKGECHFREAKMVFGKRGCVLYSKGSSSGRV